MVDMSAVLLRSDALTVDPICAAATDAARQAAAREGGSESVGSPVGMVAESDRLVTHRFTCDLPGYLGWLWHVTVVRAPGSRIVTVNEVAPLPGPSALLAPAWTPWLDRVRPGDLATGAVVPTDPYDRRLAPGWSGDDDLAGPLDPGPLHPVCWEPGLGRGRVPSVLGRHEAADRWHSGRHGPDSLMAKASPGPCSSCGWLMTIGGPLGQMFGICINALSPADGSAVALDFGCGAHSEAVETDYVETAVDVVLDEWETDELQIGHS